MVVASGLVERIGDTANSRLIAKCWSLDPTAPSPDDPLKAHNVLDEKEPLSDHVAALDHVLDYLRRARSPKISEEVAALGHRVVHGKSISEPVLIDDAALAAIEDAAELAPLHNYANLSGIKAAAKIFPGKPQVAVFDTAFHQTMPAEAYMYALPYDIYTRFHVRKYGFHGTSYSFLVQQAERLLGRDAGDLNLIVAHLGAGASVAAIRAGRSVDTSMGLTPLEGLVMGTRSGDLDPAVVPFLMDRLHLDAAGVEAVLNRKSGLLGLAGVADLRAVTAAADSGDDRAQLALKVYVHRLRRYLGAYLLHLGHVDAIIFSAGVGEHSPEIRRRALAGLQRFGIELDEAKNLEAVGKEAAIHAERSAVQVLVVPTDEELSIALQTLDVVRRRYHPGGAAAA
ncbi:hypothetical protein WJX81_005941 [Elliptochloris bilobata]|uniref:Probable acetate kinase n=1 Tax=Elliptochloris bilobata TaxID=381761 RepID=A0AAW1SKW5_9CHLO